MENPHIFSERYRRQIRVDGFGAEGQHRLSRAKVLVVGAGALGCPALMYLTGAGVGKIGVVDYDEVEITNLHRQILYTDSDVDKPKVFAAAERLALMNPEPEIVTHFLRLSTENAHEIIQPYDLVIECSDNFPTKFLVNDACVMLGKPCIIGAALGFSGQLSVYNFQGGPTYRCLIPEPPDSITVPTCEDTGVLGMIPGIIGTMQALEAVKIITGKGDILSGRLLQFDGLDANFTEFEIIAIPENKRISQLTAYELSCPDQLLKQHLIDGKRFLKMLGETSDISIIAFGDQDTPLLLNNFIWHPIPLHKLTAEIEKIPGDNTIILICEYGIKSLEALKYILVRMNIKQVFALRDGLQEIRVLGLL